jgi:deferrochelatase/peroxidase EfeB
VVAVTALRTNPNLQQVQRQVQGNILRAYGAAYRAVRHLVLQVVDPGKARAALASMTDGDRSSPDVTSAHSKPRTSGMDWCLNVGITFEGLKALGLPRASLSTFPPEFRQGMVPRAARLGDVGESAPEHWIGGLANAEQVHLLVSIHGCQPADVAPVADQVVEAQGGRAFRLVSANPFDGQALSGPDGSSRYVHFGYVDGISQPRFEGIHEQGQAVARQPFAPLGAVLLGYPTALPHLRWRVPQPETLGHNGAFNAFRILRQDVRAFDAFLDRAAAAAQRGGQPGADAELVAAKLCGRWRNGAPLTLAPDRAAADALDPARYNDFDYPFDDADGARCPIGSHIRRSNPRGAQIVQRAANRTRPIIRRGMPYGPRYDPHHPDDTPRGLLGNFMCASLAAQFEAIQYDWLNLGLQHPAITGTNDPLVGANVPATSRFVWPTTGNEPIVLEDMNRFVRTEGGAYCFLPSLPAIRWIASQGWKSAGY